MRTTFGSVSHVFGATPNELMERKRWQQMKRLHSTFCHIFDFCCWTASACAPGKCIAWKRSTRPATRRHNFLPTSR